MKFARYFNQISKKDVNLAGGKGASLGEMTQAGISVPEGFVILSTAFDKFVHESSIKPELDSILKKMNIEDTNSLNSASENIRHLILNASVPEGISEEILSEFKTINAKFVAVRSSATSEDSGNAAWAGQLDTFLNTTKNNLLENVKKCWASLFTPRAIFYRFENKLNEIEISVAVVVQKMVNSEKSGIAFSVHPVTEDQNQIIIEAGFGLGEAVVSGSITPDSYVVNKRELNIMEIEVHDQTKGLYRNPEGGSTWKELKAKGKTQKLTKKEIIELSRIITRIESHYKFPCDIEWAMEKGKFYITQSRPITTIGERDTNKALKIAWSMPTREL